jgi:acyl-CoA thioesterase
MSLVLRAAVGASSQPDPLSTSAYFLRPPSFGPAVVEVDELRVGRSVSTHRARLIEGGDVVLEMVVISGRLPTGEPDYQAAPAPEFPPLDDCPRAKPETPDGMRIGLYDVVDLRYDRTTVGWATGAPGPHEPEIRAWVRMVDGPTDPYAVIVAADALPPAVFALGARGWAPTVEMTTHVRARPVDGWLRVAARTTLSHGGWFDEDVVVWDAEGHVVGQARQLAMVNRAATRREESTRAAADDR